MRIRFCLIALLAVAGCGLFDDDDSDFPSSAIPMAPPPEFRVWWEVVESCSGRREPFDAVKWFQTGELAIRGEAALGAWFSTGNRIALLGEDTFFGPLVRHEMLHAIIQNGDHPSEYFESRCGDVVACGRDCPSAKVPSDLTRLSPADLQLDLQVFPRVPSLTGHEGRISFLLSVRNTSDRNGYLLQQEHPFSQCPAGILASSVRNPDRYVVRCEYIGGLYGLPRFFTAGETRSVVIDLDFENLGPGEGPFFAEPLVIGAVFADNVRRTTSIMLRP